MIAIEATDKNMPEPPIARSTRMSTRSDIQPQARPPTAIPVDATA